MYAIIRTGGKQYRVEPGDHIKIEKLEAKLGSELELDQVLFVGGDSAFMGEPLLKDAKVSVVVTQQDRNTKVIIFKKKRRKRYRRFKGHRQSFTEVFVKSITSPDGKTENTDAKPLIIDPEKQKEKKVAKASSPKKSTSTKKKSKKKVVKKKTKSKAKAKKKVAKKKTVKKKTKKKTTKKKS